MTDIATFVSREFKALANSANAKIMAGYMKTDQPFYGIKKPQRLPVYRQMQKLFKSASNAEYRRNILALWKLPHREEQYAAIHYAQHQKPFVLAKNLDLYKRMVREGAWWDLVDDVAIRLVGKAYLEQRPEVEGVIDQYSNDGNLWLRRTAIICQLKHKEQTDTTRLYRYCDQMIEEQEFFIRKAIGWALRQHGEVDPAGVAKYLRSRRDRLSGLSYREGSRNLIKSGVTGLE